MDGKNLKHLHPEHYHDLQKSGLSDQTITESGIESIRPSDISKELGFNHSGILSVYKIPYPGINDFCRYKLFYDPACKSKRLKYIQKKGTESHLYIPDKVRPVLRDITIPLHITEGEKKALKACQEGLHCIGLPGLWNWSDGSKNLIPDFNLVNFENRIIYIIPDNDWKLPDRHGYKKNLAKAVYELAYQLKDRWAKVFIIELPETKEVKDGNGKIGLDDYLKDHTVEDFKELLVTEVKMLSERIAEATAKTYKSLLPEIANINDPVEQEILVKALSNRIHVSVHSIRKAVEVYIPKEVRTVIGENIIIAHPSYEVNSAFLSLGFKETVVINDRPQERNIYIISYGNKYMLNDKPVLQLDKYRIIFNEKDRILISLNDKWHKDRLLQFINNPAVPEGLYSEIRDTLKQYIEFQNDATYGLIASWIIATYFHRCFNAFPFLFFYGKKQTGKSRILDILERLSFNAFKNKGVSIPSLADSIDGQRCTFLMDQAEILSDKRNIEMLGIIADSYTIGGGKRRIVNITNKRRSILEFETYAPKAFASIKEIDTDLLDRCFEADMIRAEKEYPYPEAFSPMWQNLRDKLYRLLLTKWAEAKEIYQNAGKDMIQRVRELWRPLDTILILENVQEKERQAIKDVFLESMLDTQTGLTELEDKLIQVLLEMLDVLDEDVFTVTDIVEKMEIPEADRSTKKQQAKWVGKTIKRLQLFTRYEGKGDRGRHKYLFTREKINNIFNRYKIDGFNGSMVEMASINGLQTTIKKSVLVTDGRDTIDNHHGKFDGSAGSLDNKGQNQETIKTIDYKQNKISDDFIPEDETFDAEVELL